MKQMSFTKHVSCSIIFGCFFLFAAGAFSQEVSPEIDPSIMKSNSIAPTLMRKIEAVPSQTISPLKVVNSMGSSAIAPYPCANYSITTTQKIDFDGYRWWDEDIKAAFNDPNYKGCTLTSAKLCVRYWDVDFNDQPAHTAELDVVQFGKDSIGTLTGENGQWRTMCWNVKTQLIENTGPTIPFVVNIDAAHDFDFWAVTIDYATLTTVWQCTGPCLMKEYELKKFEDPGILKPLPIEPKLTK